MMMLLKKFSIAALLMVGMAGAYAKPANDWDQREPVQIARQQQWAEASHARRDEGQDQRRGDRGGERQERQFRDGPQPQREGYGGNQGQPSQDDARRGGRMSPEDRRELRRQIDEAGRNIYAPRR